MSGLTAFQIAVARLLCSRPAEDGFLAAGHALLAKGLTTRPTEDLDLDVAEPTATG